MQSIKRNKYLFPFVKQHNAMSCGPAALATVFEYYGYKDLQAALEKKTRVSESGTSLYTLSNVANEFGFESKGLSMNIELLRTQTDEFKNLEFPFIAHLENYHFVVVYKVKNGKVFISDPAVGKYEQTFDEFINRWNGIFLTLSPTKEISREQLGTIQRVQKQYEQKKEQVFDEHFKPFLKGAKTQLSKILFLSFLQQLLVLTTPILLKFIFDNGLSNTYTVTLISILLVTIYLFLSVIRFYKTNLFLILKTNFEFDYFSSFFSHILDMKQIYFDRFKKEDFIFRYHENLKIRNYISTKLTNSFFNAVFIFLYIFVLFFIHFWSGIAATLLLSINMLVLAVFSPLLLNNTRLNFHENNKVLGSFLDKLLGIYNLKILNSQREAFKEWQESYKNSLNKILDSYFELNIYRAILYFVSSISKVIIVCFTLYLLSQNSISFGDFIAINSIFIIAINSMQQLNFIVTRCINISFSFNRISDFFLKETDNTQTQTKSSSIQNFRGLSINNLSFSYDSKEEVLQDINLDLKPGLHYGIVGRNGTGKTTLAKLIAGFYDSYKGSIQINSKELKKIDKNELRDSLLLFPNEVYIYDTTIKENLLLANKNVNEEHLQKAIQLADLQPFVENLYLGLEQRIGDRGMNLSSGEKLKVGFARLFLKNPSLIILDEATSSLDPETENEILKNTYNKYNESTIISIAHRIHTLKKVDEIIVIDNGRVAEMGSHKALYEQKDIYYEFVKKYIDY